MIREQTKRALSGLFVGICGIFLCKPVAEGFDGRGLASYHDLVAYGEDRVAGRHRIDPCLGDDDEYVDVVSVAQIHLRQFPACPCVGHVDLSDAVIRRYGNDIADLRLGQQPRGLDRTVRLGDNDVIHAYFFEDPRVFRVLRFRHDIIAAHLLAVESGDYGRLDIVADRDDDSVEFGDAELFEVALLRDVGSHRMGGKIRDFVNTVLVLIDGENFASAVVQRLCYLGAEPSQSEYRDLSHVGFR